MPFDPDDIADPHMRRRLSALMPAVTNADFERHDPPPDMWDSLTNRIARDRGRGVAVLVAPPQVVTKRDTWRRRRHGVSRPRVLLAAAAAVTVAVGAAIVVQSRLPAERVVARATLQQLEPLGDTRASARLVTKDGTTQLVVDATNMPPAPPSESYELWLIDNEVSDPRSLGEVTGSEEVTVPASVDPSTHPIVDISLEPDDGDHDHSGHSLMRGTLQ